MIYSDSSFDPGAEHAHPPMPLRFAPTRPLPQPFISQGLAQHPFMGTGLLPQAQAHPFMGGGLTPQQHQTIAALLAMASLHRLPQFGGGGLPSLLPNARRF